MIQTYQGYFQADGRFVADNSLVEVPAMRRAIVNILDDEIVDVNTANRQKRITFEKMFADAEKAESALTEEEWVEFENLRSQTDLTREVGKWSTP